MFDGEAILRDVAEATRAPVRAGHMPEVVLVGVENTDRVRDLSPPGIPVSGNDGNGTADEFWQFLEYELRSKLARDFRATGPLYLVGHSSGGLFVTWAAGPRIAGALALDAPVHLGDAVVARTLVGVAKEWNSSTGAGEPARPIRLVSVEARFGWSDQDWAMLTGAQPEGWLLARERMPGETHLSVVYPGSYLGLRALFSEYGGHRDRERPPHERLVRFDERVGAMEAPNAPEEVAAMPPPRSLLDAVVEDRIIALDGTTASEVVTRIEAAYGADERTGEQRERIAAIRPDDLEGPTLDELLATPMATPTEASHLLGEWSGYTAMEGARQRTPLRLSVRDVGGAVAAAFTLGSTPPHEVEYLKVDGNETHIGYMNRMNPRGMLLYEGIVEGDVFEGTFELRGVVFRLPGGRELPVTRFRLERTHSGRTPVLAPYTP